MASSVPQHRWNRTAGRARYRTDGLVCAPPPQMVEEAAAWDDLAERAVEPNPFFESWYLLPSLERFDGGRKTTFLRFVHKGALSGLMPVARQTRYAGWPIAHVANWLHPNMFLGTPLLAQGAEAPFWRAVFGWADANPALALFLHLNEIALDGPVFAGLQAALAADERPWAVVRSHERALLSSELEPHDYLARSLPSRKRKDLDRRFRRLVELGTVEFKWETGSQDLAQWIDDFIAMEASGWKGAAGSALACDDATDGMFRESLMGAAGRGRLARLSLLLDGKPIAMLSTFLAPPGAFGFKTAFDESYASFSPGFLLEREYLAVLKRLGVSWCDSCAAPDHSVMNRIWQERRTVGRVSIAIGGSIRRALFGQLLRKETAGAVRVAAA
jgi:CelD/BcsL family acetyltransferase involved in cellulose biosynthesis